MTINRVQEPQAQPPPPPPHCCRPAYLKKPLQPSQVMALKWKPVALSPHTPQMRGTFLSNSSGARVEVLTAVDSITRGRKEGYEKRVRKNKLQKGEKITLKPSTTGVCLA